MKKSLYRPIVVWFTIFGGLVLSGLAFAGSKDASLPPPDHTTSNGVINIVPDHLTLTGDVTTVENSQGYCTEPWFTDTPTGTIILGVNPENCDPETWQGGTATAEIFLPNLYPSTLYVVRFAWPDRDGKGLHSPYPNQTAVITLNGNPVWSKRTTDLSTFGDYYAAEHEAILTTLVVTQSLTHTFSISVPAHTAWDLSLISLTPYSVPTSIRGIGYSPYRDCQAPGGLAQPTAQEVQEDLVRLSHTSNFIRTYAATGINREIPALANAQGLPIFAGAWLDYNGSDLKPDEEEIQALINIANTDDLEGAIVGNEFYLRHISSESIDYLLQRIQQVRSGVSKPIPLMTGEIDSLMFTWEGASITITGIHSEYRPILDEVDFILVHIYPFWMGLPIEGAAAFTVARYQAIQTLIEQEYPGENKRVIIGETGWPSAGSSIGQAIPSLENQKRYMREFMFLAEQGHVDYMYFDGFDELWKTEGGVGSHWGYSYFDRAAKHSFYGVLIPGKELFPFLIYLPLTFQNASNNSGFFTSAPENSQNFSEAIQTTTSFPVYTDWPGMPNGFVPSYIGDYENIMTYACDRSDPFEGEMAIRATFVPTGTLGWGGENWLYPANNQADLEEGMDLSWANKISFQAKGAVGGEKIEFFAGGAGTVHDPYPESLRPMVSTGYLTLSSNWQTYIVDLRGKDLTHIITGFGWTTTKCANPGGATFYLDNIIWEYDPNLPAPTSQPTFPIYLDAAAQDNHYIPSNWMGDATIAGHVALSECWGENPHSGLTSIQSAYTQASSYGWAGVYWAHPAENWGDRPGGYDLTGAKRLTFWARSETGNPQITFLIGGVGYYEESCTPIPGFPYSDSVCPTIKQTETLSPIWTMYTIDLIQNPRLLNSVVGGFGWVSNSPIIFYLDDIIYEFE